MSSSALSFSRVVFARHYHSSTEIVLQKALKPAGLALRVRKELIQVRGMMESAESGNGTGEEFSKPRVVVKRLLSRAQPEGEGATVWRSIGRCVFLCFSFLFFWYIENTKHLLTLFVSEEPLEFETCMSATLCSLIGNDESERWCWTVVSSRIRSHNFVLKKCRDAFLECNFFCIATNEEVELKP